MAKLDRLGWADGISFVSYGVRIGVRVNKPGALDLVVNHLPPGSKPATSVLVERLYSLIVGGDGPRANVRRFNLLYAGIVKLARAVDIDQVLEILESDVQFYVAQVARRRIFVHAGVVGLQGRAILIPGRSFSGKTTLVAELVRAGATYYSDEYAVLDPRGRVHPYTRPLAMRESETGRMKKYSVEELGGLRGNKPLPVGLVVMSKYKAGGRWRPRLLSPGQGALALLDNTVSARQQPEAALSTFKHIAHVPVLKGVRGEAREVVDFIIGQF